MKVEYLPDASVDASLDAELRRLLTTCFTKPQDVVFQDRRYFASRTRIAGSYAMRRIPPQAQGGTACEVLPHL